MAVPGRAQFADRREPGRAGPADDRAGAGGRGGRDRFWIGGDPGPAARFRRTPAAVARAPERARGDLLPGRDRGDGRPRARNTARHSQITPALRARRATQATPAERRDRGDMTNNRLPWDITATDADDAKADDEKAGAAAAAQVVRRLIVVLLLTAAALDLTRCGLVLTAARPPSPTAALVAAGLAATGLTGRTARG